MSSTYRLLALLLLPACRRDDGARPASGSDPASLDGAVEVIRDAEGVPHVYARTEDDAFFAQGYVTARDRLFQMDLLRRRAWGRRAEVLGEDLYESDLQSRALRFAEHGEATIAALETDDPELHAIMIAYAAGVNAYIDDARAGRSGASLAPQFAALGYEPEPWTAADCAAIEKLLTAGLSMRPDQDLTLGLVKMLLGDDLFADLYQFAPLDDAYVVPGFYGGAQARENPPPPGDSAVASARSGGRRGGSPRQDGEEPGGENRFPHQALSDVPPEDVLAAIRRVRSWDLAGGGSNAMAVAASASAGGHALLASDSHQGLGHPAVYYLIHLSTAEHGGDLDVVGATFPGAPLVLFGHNAQAAWGPTTNLFDVSDAYLETVVSDDEVAFEGEAAALEVDEQVISVRLADGSIEDRSVTTKVVPHHGPVFPPEALPLPLTVSIRWTGYQPRSVARAFYEMGKAGSFDDFRAALRHYYCGGMHWLYADTSGRIGYSGYTHVPVREAVDPAAPPVTLLPGAGGYEWLPGEDAPYAYLGEADVPWIADPAAGWLTTANNDPAGLTADNDPFNDPVYLSGIFDLGTRAWQPGRRFESLLAESGAITFEDLRAAQLDTLSRPGELLAPYLLQAAARRPDLLSARGQAAIDLLAGWDYTCETDSAACTLFHAWLAVATEAVLSDEAGGLLNDLLFADMDYKLGLVTVKLLHRFLEATDADLAAIEAGEIPFPSASGDNFFDDGDTPALETRDEVLVSALESALAALADRYADLVEDPDDPSLYAWGLYHTLQLLDDAHAALPEASSARYPKSGGLYTVDVADFSWLKDGALPEAFDVSNAPSNRFLFELEAGAIRGEMILPGGQSERPGDTHHNDMLEEYLAGEYRQMRFYRDEVEAGAAETFTLPAGFPR